MLEVPWSRVHAHVIGRLESLGENLPAGALVVARVVRRRGRLVGEPVSLVLPGRAVNPIDALHFDDGPGRPPSPLVERLLTSSTPDQPVPDNGESRPAAVPVPLADLRALIEAEAQRGCAGVAPGVIHDRVAQAHRNLRHAGISVFAGPTPAVSPAEALLRCPTPRSPTSSWWRRARSRRTSAGS
jgi:hypothetical protein